MRVKVLLVSFKSKLSRPCKKFVSIFRFKLKRPVFIGALIKPPSFPNKHLTRLLSFLCLLKKKKTKNKMMTKKNLNRLNEIRSFSDAVSDSTLLQSPLTPAYDRRELLRDENIEDACRSFENYMVHMIVEEGKVEDLTDIEQLLYCWRNLKSPIFIDLVSRFYGELCKDLFSTGDGDREDNDTANDNNGRNDNDGQKGSKSRRL